VLTAKAFAAGGKSEFVNVFSCILTKKVKVKLPRYRPRQALGVPGG
jgi:hypothetical protein